MTRRRSVDEVTAFVYERYVQRARAQATTPRAIDAVLCRRRPELHEVRAPLAAVRAFLALPEAAALAAANKRVGNILKKSERAGRRRRSTAALLVEPAERALARRCGRGGPRAESALRGAATTPTSLQALAALQGAGRRLLRRRDGERRRSPALRANRLALLAELRAAMNRVADLSRCWPT